MSYTLKNLKKRSEVNPHQKYNWIKYDAMEVLKIFKNDLTLKK